MLLLLSHVLQLRLRLPIQQLWTQQRQQLSCQDVLSLAKPHFSKCAGASSSIRLWRCRLVQYASSSILQKVMAAETVTTVGEKIAKVAMKTATAGATIGAGANPAKMMTPSAAVDKWPEEE